MSTKQTITIDVELLGKVDQFSGTIKKLQSELGQLSLGKGLTDSFNTSFNVLNREIEKIQSITAKKKINVVDEKSIRKSLDEIERVYAQVVSKIQSEGVNTSFLKQDKRAIEALSKAQANYSNQIKDTKQKQTELNREIEKAQKALSKGPQNAKNKTVVSDEIYKGYQEAVAQAQAERDALRKEANRKTYESGNKKSDEIRAREMEAYNKAQALANQLKQEFNRLISQSDYDKGVKELTQGLDQAKAKLQEFNSTLGQKNDAAALEKIKQDLLAIKEIDWSALGVDINAINSVEQLNNAFIKVSTDGLQRAKQTQDSVNVSVNQGSQQFNEARTKIENYGRALQEMTDRERDIQGIKSRITHFFGLANAINLARRAMRQAFNAVKELDAAMTETAVVTDFSVGDMWDQLPRYTEAANKLGATTLGAYQTMTLFYQQGLDTNEAFALGTETMKMARIAGLDYADATDKMTAALRGFNMELNEASAQRVNDVYSELAAITAADTEEIANAMTKTASIAHNANMEFETTAAFLSQIIETTRESAETAGTAMKTVIARFQELKKDPSEIGEVDGEIVDANKIETALRSVGVALRDSTGQFRDLDDVFLELASKWDGLDTNTQRYIATIAAGSRQQSRFIAMMSNYERTIELVNAANNSAGASQNQFNKTLESLEAKLNNLKNAWNEFTMGITNNQAIKAGVDILTGLLNVINKVTGVAGNEGIGGLITAVSKLALAWTGLRAGKAVLAGLRTSLSKAGVEAGISMSRGIRDGFAAEFSKGSAIKKIISRLKVAPVVDTSALNTYKTQLTAIAQTEQYYSRILASTTANTVEARQARMMMASLTEAEANNELELCAALNLTEEQQKQTNIMKAAGIPYDQAAIIAKDNLTQAQLREMAITELGNDKDEEAIAITMAKIAADKAEEITSKNLSFSKGRLLSIVLFGTAAQKAEALAILETAGAEQVATFWTWALKLSMAELVLIILGVVAAVALLVVGMVALVKHAKATSIEGQFKNAQEEAERAAEKVKELTEAYDSLTSAIEAVEEKRDALDEMIYGTQEWRDAVKEVNSEMLKIAQLDPDLAPFITNNNGVLEFDYNKTNYKGQTYEDVMSEKESNLNKAQQIEIGTRIEVSEKKINKIRDEYSQYGLQGTVNPNGTTFGNAIQGSVTWSNEEKRENENQIARDTASGKIVTTGDYDADVKAYSEYLANEFGITGQAAIEMSHQLALNGDGLLEFGNALIAAEGEIEGYTNALVAGAVSDSELKGDQAATGAVFLQSRIDQLIEKNKIDPTKLTTEDRQNYADIFGFELIGGQLYSRDDQGKLVKEKDITDEDIATQLAYSYAVEEGTSAMIGFVNNIDKVGGAFGTLMKETYAAADGMGITQDSLKEFFGEDKRWKNGLDDTERRELMGDVDEEGNYIGEGTTVLSKAWEALPSEIKASFASYEEFANYQLDAWNNAALAYVNATELIGNTFAEGSGISAMLDGLIAEFDLTAGEAKALSSALYDVAMNGGDANSFLSQMNSILSGIKNPEDRDRALALINSTDWTDTEEVDKTIAALKDMGIEVGEGFREQILKATNAVRKFDMDKINSELEKTGEAIDIITEKAENDEVIYSKEERDKLVTAGADSEKFVRTGIDEYTYIGETNELLASIEKITAQILGEVAKDLEKEIEIGKKTDAYGERRSEIEGFRDKSNAEVIEWLKDNPDYVPQGRQGEQVLGIAKELGINIEGLDAQGIIDAIITHWDSYYGKAEGWQAELDTYNSEMGTLNYANMDLQELINQGTYQRATGEAVMGAGFVQTGTETAFVEEAGFAIEGLIAQEEGFYKVLEGVTGSLEKQGSAIAKDTNFLKVHALGVIKDRKEVDKMNEVLEENKDILKEGDKNSQAYGAAIEDVTKEAKKVFGEHIEAPFVEENIDQFLALEEGGETADAAWKTLVENSRQAWIDVNASALDGTTELNNIIAAIDGTTFGIDGTADMSQIFAQLAYVLGDAQKAAEFLESMNYSVKFEEAGWTAMKIGYDPYTNRDIYTQIPNYKTTVTKGDYKGTGSRAPSGGGGGGGGKEEKWENPYDEFYNITEQINEELRTREQIEHDYNKLLKDRRTSIDEIRQSQLDQIASLRRELDLQQQLLEGRRRQYSEIGQETYADEEGNYKSFSEWGVTKYASYDDKTGLITIDWEGIDQITDTEFGGAVEAYISQIEEWSGSIEDIEDEIRDIEDQIEEIKNAEKDAYLEFEERIYEALVEADQKVIDTYQELSDTISDSNEKILNSLSESIELERQIRDNTKTEEEIADKEARLAYLRRDTSGANDLEIKQLEEELADARESYGDTLIDQELDRLNKVNEEANAQREQQIALMQAQLDWNEQNGIYWARVDSLLANAINSDGTFNYNSELATILEESEAFKGMSAFGQMNWINELVEEFLTANRGFENWMIDRAEEEGTVVLAGGKTASYNRENQTWTDESGNSYEDLVYNADTKTYSLANPIKKEEAEESDTSVGDGTITQPEVEKPVLDENTKRGVSAAIWYGPSSGWGQGSTRSARLKEVFGENDIQDNYVNKKVQSGFIGSVSDYTYANMKKKFLGFKTGGLADFTGPAWLDGTKTRPELVLNQTDTQNFIQLKDILSSLLNRGSSNTQTSGDNYYNFDITVEEIGSDYDVDQMIDRVRERIYDDASYRNVNAINFLR